MEVIWKIEDGPALIVPQEHKDDRGYFMETFRVNEFKEKVADVDFVQENQSKSSFGTLRGMHCQTGEHAQAKLVSVTKGSVVDVVVDARKDSPNYGKTYYAYLSEQNHRQLFVPRGFLHGFLTLEDDTIFQYKCDNYYNKESEKSANWNSINFDWYTYLSYSEIKVSDKDLVAPNFNDEIYF